MAAARILSVTSCDWGWHRVCWSDGSEPGLTLPVDAPRSGVSHRLTGSAAATLTYLLRATERSSLGGTSVHLCDFRGHARSAARASGEVYDAMIAAGASAEMHLFRDTERWSRGASAECSPQLALSLPKRRKPGVRKW